MEENFSTGREWVGGGSGSNVSDGEWQMNLQLTCQRLIFRCAAQFQTAHGPVLLCSPVVGDPWSWVTTFPQVAQNSHSFSTASLISWGNLAKARGRGGV